ncbi:MAG: DUF296 domain-containing protein [Desulfurococcales archaeon]|nr:DUF296 domain-containing protein [Desulfurococcales archaeon]
MPEGSKPHQYIENVLSEQGIKAAWINGLGGFRWARVGFLNVENRSYYVKDVEARYPNIIEVSSLIGNSILGPDGSYYTHIHVTLGIDEDTTIAGHLIDANVEPFLELLIVELVGDYTRMAELLSHRWAHAKR